MRADGRRSPTSVFGANDKISSKMTAHTRRGTPISNVFAAGVIVFSLWLNIEASIGGVVVPGVVALGAGSILTLLLLRSWTISSGLRVAAIASLFCFISLFSLLERSHFVDLLKGCAQLGSSMVVSASLVFWLQKRDPARIAVFLYWLVVCVLLLALLETFVPQIRDGGNVVREQIYGGRSLYDSNERDIRTYGLVRPLVLAREPAHLGFFIAVCITIWAAVGRARARYVQALILLAWTMISVRTPVVVVGIAAVISLWAYERAILGKLSAARIALGLTLSFALMACALLVFGERFRLIQSGDDFSATARLIGPPFIAFDILKVSPLFGLGPGSAEAISPFVKSRFYLFGFDGRLGEFSDREIGNFVTNYFWLHWIYFGVVGGAIAVYLLHKLARYMGAHRPTFVIYLFFLFGQAIGGYVNLRVWVTFALLTWALAVIDARARAAEPIAVPC